MSLANSVTLVELKAYYDGFPELKPIKSILFRSVGLYDPSSHVTLSIGLKEAKSQSLTSDLKQLIKDISRSAALL